MVGAYLPLGTLSRRQMPPEVNYWTVLENREIKQEVHLGSVPCRANRLSREPRHSSLLVAGGPFATRSRPCTNPLCHQQPEVNYLPRFRPQLISLEY